MENWQGPETLVLAFDIGTTLCTFISLSSGPGTALLSLSQVLMNRHRVSGGECRTLGAKHACDCQKRLKVRPRSQCPPPWASRAETHAHVLFRWPGSPKESKIPSVVLYGEDGRVRALGAETLDDAVLDEEESLSECKVRLWWRRRVLFEGLTGFGFKSGSNFTCTPSRCSRHRTRL